MNIAVGTSADKLKNDDNKTNKAGAMSINKVSGGIFVQGKIVKVLLRARFINTEEIITDILTDRLGDVANNTNSASIN